MDTRWGLRAGLTLQGRGSDLRIHAAPITCPKWCQFLSQNTSAATSHKPISSSQILHFSIYFLLMRRVQLAASRLFTKSKEAALSPEASAVIVQVLKIASTINVPFCQTACNAIVAFIEMGEVRSWLNLCAITHQMSTTTNCQAASTNDRQWQMLLDTIKIYTCRISEFMEAISDGRPPDYLATSDDLRARVAREAVKDFETYAQQDLFSRHN